MLDHINRLVIRWNDKSGNVPAKIKILDNALYYTLNGYVAFVGIRAFIFGYILLNDQCGKYVESYLLHDYFVSIPYQMGFNHFSNYFFVSLAGILIIYFNYFFLWI